MFPTERQDYYIKTLEQNLHRSIFAVIYNTILSKGGGFELIRKFPKTMTNDDVQSIINSINKFTKINEPILWKRYNNEAISKKEIETLLTEYRILELYYKLPIEAEIIKGLMNKF
jgi:hypothetical protein